MERIQVLFRRMNCFDPATWDLIEEHLLDDDVSDHRAVIATFRVGR